jgi:[acyl-carrier-protein] S-malonyltransferase
MITDGGTEFIEVGPDKVLQGLMRKIDRSVAVIGAAFEYF